jgi:hypothetical protein
VLDALIREVPSHAHRAGAACSTPGAAVAGCDAGEPRRAAGDAPLLRYLREGHAELHRQAVVRQRGLRGTDVRRPEHHDTRLAARLVTARAELDARRDAAQGRHRSHVLPDRHHVRAEATRPAAARRRLHRDVATRPSTAQPTSRAPAAGRSSSAHACSSRSRRSPPHRATAWRSSTRCPPASSPSTRASRPPSVAAG